MHSNDRPRGCKGHMDNGVLLVILPILSAVAALSLYQRITGQSPVTLWQNLPDDMRDFSVRAPLLLLGVVVVVAVGAAAGGSGVSSARDGDCVRIRLRDPGLRALSLGLFVMAIYMGWAGLAGQGLFWWIVLALAVILGFAGFSLAAVGDRIVVEPGKIASERTFFGTVSSSEEHATPSAVDADISVDERESGGAFGQPVRFSYAVSVGSVEVHTDTNESRAEAVREALVNAIAELGISAEADHSSQASSELR